MFKPKIPALLENLLYLQRFHFFIFSVSLLQQIYNKKVKYPSKYNVKMHCLLLSNSIQSVACINRCPEREFDIFKYKKQHERNAL